MAPIALAKGFYPVPSPDGEFIATVQPSSLSIRCASTSRILHTYPLPRDFYTRCRHIKWSPVGEPTAQAFTEDSASLLFPSAQRILLADEDTVRVFDLTDLSWSAVIDNASNAATKIIHVAFGSTSNEIITISDFGAKMMIWSLNVRKGAEVQNPKYALGANCYDIRAGTGHLAILTKVDAQDSLVVLGLDRRTVVKSFELGTVDARQVAWSPNGHWIAVTETVNVGHKVLLYTADGHLFKTWTLGEGDGIGLGVKRIQWDETRNVLAIGDQDDTIYLLGKDTLMPLFSLAHAFPIQNARARVWEERISDRRERSYAAATQTADAPRSEMFAKTTPPKNGISSMSFNANGSLLASRSDSTPTTVWMWSLETGNLAAVLIHHAPVKHLEWHSSYPDILLIHCSIPDPIVYVFNASWQSPTVIPFQLDPKSIPSRFEASWLQTGSDSASNATAKIMLAFASNYASATISVNDGSLLAPDSMPMVENTELEAATLSIGTGPEDMFDEGNSLDLSPIKLSHGVIRRGEGLEGFPTDEGFGMTQATDEDIDDTFLFHRRIGIGNSSTAVG